jgi:glycosyltransferase involved in cell wall biosynthesis
VKIGQEPLISVVVPVHMMAGKLQNLEKTLKESQASNLPIQYLLIHDGDDQGTAEELRIFVENYSAEYHQVKFESPGLTRNHGLDFASAPWITFWDSDDLGEPKRLYAAVSIAPQDTMVLIGGFKIHSVTSGVTTDIQRPERNLSSLMLNPGGWRFAFRKNYIGNVRFPSFSMGEDQVFLAQLNMKESEVEYIDDYFYTYFKGSDSQLTMKEESIAQVQKAILEVEDFIFREKVVERYLYVLNARLAFTALKYREYSIFKFVSYFVGKSKLDLSKRFYWILGFIQVSKFLVFSSRHGNQ